MRIVDRSEGQECNETKVRDHGEESHSIAIANVDTLPDFATVELLDRPIVSRCAILVEIIAVDGSASGISVACSVSLNVLKLRSGERLNLFHNIKLDSLSAWRSRERALVMPEVFQFDFVKETFKVNHWPLYQFFERWINICLGISGFRRIIFFFLLFDTVWIEFGRRLRVIVSEKLFDHARVSKGITILYVEENGDGRVVVTGLVLLAIVPGLIMVDPMNLHIIMLTIDSMLGRRVKVHLHRPGSEIGMTVLLPNFHGSIGFPLVGIWEWSEDFMAKDI